MNESGIYNESDLDPFHKRIAELRQIIKNDEEVKRHPKGMIKLLERQLKDCGMSLPIESIPTLAHRMVVNAIFDDFHSQMQSYGNCKTPCRSSHPNSLHCTNG